MKTLSTENKSGPLGKEELESVVLDTIAQVDRVKTALLIHPDYSRHDFAHLLAPAVYRALEKKGLERLDTLNAAGTHRAMTESELQEKLGMSKASFPLLGSMFNHEFDSPEALVNAGEIASSFTSAKTGGHLDIPLPIKVNKLLFGGYDLILAVSGTVPHEGTGYSGGTKIFFPGVSGPEVTGLFHWAAVLIGIPQIIGQVENAARDVVNEGVRQIFERLSCPVVAFNMVYTEDEKHQIVPNGLYSGYGLEGFDRALRAAAGLSAELHIKHLERAKKTVVQQIPSMYDEIWTAGKGSYKLQRPGVIEEGGEIILYAPHIHCFHSNAKMDRAMREIGYHGREYVLDYCKRHPEFDKNVAAHMINVRGQGRMTNGKESFPFKVTLATQISEEECRAVNLDYRDPESLREEQFQDESSLWIREGGQWLYSRC